LNRLPFAVALAGIALVSLPFDASAQASNPIRFGIAAGAAVPVSDLGDAYDLGFNGTVTIGLQPSMIPLGIRIDGAYNQFAAKDNFEINIPGFGSGSANKFGWNIGGGIKLPLSGFDTFLEARYNQVQGEDGSLKFIPITFGVMF